jgi:hypothetical protein
MREEEPSGRPRLTPASGHKEGETIMKHRCCRIASGCRPIRQHTCRHRALHYSSIAGLIEDSFKRYASRPAYTCMGKTITYSEMESLSSSDRRLAAIAWP